MTQAALLLRNTSRVAYLELLWGLRIPENVAYNFFLPLLIFVVLGLVKPSPEYLTILVPGIIALSTASSAMQGLGKTVSFMRIYGTWRTIQASPIPAGTYLAGLLSSRLLRMLITVAMLLGIATWGFGFETKGSVALTFVYALLGGAVFGSLGLLLAYLVRSPQAVASLNNLVLLPMVFTSKVFFTVEAGWVQAIAALLPLTFLVDLLRDNATGVPMGRHTLIGVGVLLLWLALFGWAAVVLSKLRVEER